MNIGIVDIYNLIWKLKFVFDGVVLDIFFDIYDIEWWFVVGFNVEQSVCNVKKMVDVGFFGILKVDNLVVGGFLGVDVFWIRVQFVVVILVQ